MFIGLVMEKYGIKGFVKEQLSGRIKTYPEDFIVEEIAQDGKQYTISYGFLEAITDMLPKKRNEYLHATLVKRNYTTERAIARLSDALRISRTRFRYAGTKDKRALTAQRISIWNTDIKKVKALKFRDLFLKNFSYSNERMNLGNLQGNRFTITIRDIPDATKIPATLYSFSERIKNGIPNHFGPQRFGVQRQVNHLIGKQLLLGNFEGAALILLTVAGDENPEAKEARQFAARNWGDWNGILKELPRTLGVEAAVVNYLVQYPNDYANAMRKIPKNLRRMFIHAFQSLVFNRTVSELAETGALPEKLPLIGYETRLEGPAGKVISNILKTEQIRLDDFRLKRMPEISESGSERASMVFPKDFKVLKIKNNTLKLRFTLDKGSYATVVLLALLGDYVE
jgi:tRNA pseudouridine13 synthase